VLEPIERSTCVLLASLVLTLKFWVWTVHSEIVRAILIGIYAAGLFTVFVSTILINPFDLFGLRQVNLYLRGRKYTHPEFRTPLFYRYV
jgi:hypothetical protein